MWCYLEVGEQILTEGKAYVCVQCGDSKCGGQGERVGVGSLLTASMNELNKSKGDHAGCLKREKMCSGCLGEGRRAWSG